MAVRTSTFTGSVQNTGSVTATFKVRLTTNVWDDTGMNLPPVTSESAEVRLGPGTQQTAPVLHSYVLSPNYEAFAIAQLFAVDPPVASELARAVSGTWVEPLAAGPAGALAGLPTISTALRGAVSGRRTEVSVRDAVALRYAVEEHYNPGQAITVLVFADRPLTVSDAEVARAHFAAQGIPAQVSVARAEGTTGLAVRTVRPYGPAMQLAFAFDGMSFLLGIATSVVFLVRDQLAANLVPLVVLVGGGLVALAALNTFKKQTR